MEDEPERQRVPRDQPLHGAPFPHDRLHPSLYGAEFLGTALLVGVGVSIVILMFGQGSPVERLVPGAAMRRFLTGGLFGSVATLIAISPLGKVSGAHINPAVTLAFWLEGKLAWRDATLYVLAQFAGAVAGALPLLAWGAMGQSMSFGATVPGQGMPVWAALMGEAGVTFLLVMTIFTTAAHPRTRNFTPFTMPILFSVLVWLEAPVSGTSANPARSFGPALIAGVFDHQWIYFVGPSLGAILAIGVIRLEALGLPRVTVARLFHFHAP
jgi:aquaporin Z